MMTAAKHDDRKGHHYYTTASQADAFVYSSDDPCGHHGREAVIMGEEPSSWARGRHHGRGAVIMGEGPSSWGKERSSWARGRHHGRGTVIMGEERSSWGRNGHHGRRYYGALFEGKHATQQGTIASTLHS